jgi:hypothetical protein
MLVQQMGHGPLCPMSTPPAHPNHDVRKRMLNGFYGYATRAADGNMTPEVDKAYRGAQDTVTDFMDLFTAETTALPRGVPCTVTAWWFRCRTCGFVLPAHAEPYIKGPPQDVPE